MKFEVFTYTRNNGEKFIYFGGIDAWDDFDLLLDGLNKEEQCEKLSVDDLIYIRRAVLLKDGIKFQLMHDDSVGNFLLTRDKKVVPVLEELAKSVVDRIKKKIKAKGFAIED